MHISSSSVYNILDYLGFLTQLLTGYSMVIGNNFLDFGKTFFGFLGSTTSATATSTHFF